MAIYILIHGAWHGGWAWDRVAPLLTKAGHLVIAPDLPTQEGVTLAHYVDFIANLIDEQEEPVILVGHSMAGVILSALAERMPDKIAKNIYLCALLLENGKCALDMFQAYPTPHMECDFNSDYSSCVVKPDMIVNALYNTCDAADTAQASAKLTPQATAIFSTPLVISEENYGRVPRFYIECTKDHALLPEMQQAMSKAMPGTQVFSLDTDHAPFLSMAGKLSDILLTISKS
jgi:pimeloyl-ACP methyl ester carboxylesterase